MSNRSYSDDLYHYGIIGMRWGVRRSKKQLVSARNASERDEAVSKLNEHREKGVNKIDSLRKRDVWLQKQVVRNETKASNYAKKAARERMTKYQLVNLVMPSIEKRFHERQAVRADLKSSKRMSAASRYKTLMNWNQKSINMFQREINKIDVSITEAGKRFIDENSQKLVTEIKEE